MNKSELYYKIMKENGIKNPVDPNKPYLCFSSNPGVERFYEVMFLMNNTTPTVPFEQSNYKDALIKAWKVVDEPIIISDDIAKEVENLKKRLGVK